MCTQGAWTLSVLNLAPRRSTSGPLRRDRREREGRPRSGGQVGDRDACAGVELVAAVDADEQGREGLEDAGHLEGAAVHEAGTGDLAHQALDDLLGVRLDAAETDA